MRLQARLVKIENTYTADALDLRKLTDEELIEGMRANLIILGIDWDEFKDDPRGAASKRFEGVPDDDGLIAGFLDAVGRLGGCRFELSS